MKYTVKCGCGHTQALDLYGSSKEREHRLAWMRSPSGRCNTCYAAGKRDDAQHEHELAVQRLVLAGLGQLDREPNPASALESLLIQV